MATQINPAVSIHSDTESTLTIRLRPLKYEILKCTQLPSTSHRCSYFISGSPQFIDRIEKLNEP